MLVVDRVVLASLDQPEQVRELQRDQAVVLDQRAQPGGEILDVRHVGEHVVRRHQVGPAVGRGDVLAGGGAEELDLGPDAAGPGRLSHVGRGLDPQHRDARGQKVLQQVAVVAGHLGDQAAGGEVQPLDHRVGVAFRVRDPGVGIGGEVGVVGEDILTGHVSRQLDQQAVVAQPDVQRIEDLGVVEPLRRKIAFAQRRHPEIDEGASKRRAAQAALMRRWHELMLPQAHRPDKGRANIGHPAKRLAAGQQGGTWTIMRAGRAAAPTATWCWTWASSPPATTSRGATTRGRTRCTRCRCGCALHAAWPSCWLIRPSPRNRGAPSRLHCRLRPLTRWPGWPPAGCCRSGRVVAEYGSPHGGSWLGAAGGPRAEARRPDEQADVILDCFGLMHAADQRAALAERAARLAPGGVLLLQYHALSTILSARAVERAAARAFRLLLGHRADRHAGGGRLASLHGLAVRPVRRHGAAGRERDRRGAGPAGCRGRRRCWPRTPASASGILTGSPSSRTRCEVRARAVYDWLAAQRAAGTQVLGYGAASRAVALLCQAHVDHALLPAVIDASPAKQGLRMPGTDIPVAAPAELASRHPRAVLLFVPDLMGEVRSAYPEVEQAGGRWVDVETLGSRSLQQDT